jgi:hypothetical protein
MQQCGRLIIAGQLLSYLHVVACQALSVDDTPPTVASWHLSPFLQRYSFLFFNL